MFTRWHRGTALLVVCLVLGATNAAHAATAPRSGGTTTPAALLGRVVAAAKSEHTVRTASRSIQAAGVTVTVETQAGSTAGIQQIAYEKNHVTGHLEDLVVGGKAYFAGDSFSLMNFFGFDAFTAGHIAGQWVSIARTNSAFEVVAADITLPSVVSQLQVPAALTTSSKSLAFTPVTKVEGIEAIGITGSAVTNGTHTSATIYVRQGSDPLPVAEVEQISGSKGSTSTTFFGDWNKTVKVSKPRSAIPISKVPSG